MATANRISGFAEPRGQPSAPCAIFVANRAFGLAKSRLLIMRHLIERGWRVVAAGRRDAHVTRLQEAGVEFVEMFFSRGGLSLKSDWRAYQDLASLYRELRPSIVHHFQAKPVILGGSAAGRFSKSIVVNTITGLGHAFIAGGASKWLALAGYRRALRRASATVFQNRDDLRFFLDRGLVDHRQTRLIVSSGVDVRRFRPPENAGAERELRVVMVSRLLWEKGVGEFVEAARQCRYQWPNARFQLIGEMDPEHPDAIPDHNLKAWTAAGWIEYLGYVSQLENLLPGSAMVVLPSYREGVPRVLLEGAACGSPVIAADTPGCREAVLPEKTGLLVPPKNASALAEAIGRLLANSEERRRMGDAGARWMAAEFDERIIANKHVELYRELGAAL